MNENWLFVRFGHNCLLLSLLSFRKKRKLVQIFWMDASLIQVAPSVVIWVGLPTHIVALLVWKRIYPGDRKKKKVMNGSSLSDLCCSCSIASHRWLVGISSSKRWKVRTPFRVMGVMDHLPCCLTTSVGLMLLTRGLGPHS
jgi:hypothetical protein